MEREREIERERQTDRQTETHCRLLGVDRMAEREREREGGERKRICRNDSRVAYE